VSGAFGVRRNPEESQIKWVKVGRGRSEEEVCPVIGDGVVLTQVKKES